jgi:hypothetical protein
MAVQMNHCCAMTAQIALLNGDRGGLAKVTAHKCVATTYIRDAVPYGLRAKIQVAGSPHFY